MPQNSLAQPLLGVSVCASIRGFPTPNICMRDEANQTKNVTKRTTVYFHPLALLLLLENRNKTKIKNTKNIQSGKIQQQWQKTEMFVILHFQFHFFSNVPQIQVWSCAAFLQFPFLVASSRPERPVLHRRTTDQSGVVVRGLVLVRFFRGLQQGRPLFGTRQRRVKARTRGGHQPVAL